MNRKRRNGGWWAVSDNGLTPSFLPLKGNFLLTITEKNMVSVRAFHRSKICPSVKGKIT
ncbi:hypothetical protein DJ90_1694 [Paenibacillus macerans]|uniref:Uncharacterized protein n=1 Tax=Paenibacillus macerans TaxID=44252 RepID=A0A090ZCP5_PAEMA|nr:hypothetical protein DJ90_1694 [Paenibacillus macerans]